MDMLLLKLKFSSIASFAFSAQLKLHLDCASRGKHGGQEKCQGAFMPPCMTKSADTSAWPIEGADPGADIMGSLLTYGWQSRIHHNRTIKRRTLRCGAI
jgi:hypothetical protein